jgi:3',5'-cyclic-AMP phosphodiesterase
VSARLLQLTDLHCGSSWAAHDPLDALRTVIDAVRSLPDPPHVVLVTGDLANAGLEEQYAPLPAVLDTLGLPVHVIPGNHDDRAALRRHFALPGTGAEPIQYALELDGLRVLMLDTQRPGETAGELGRARLEWLDARLRDDPRTPTVVAMHHPPFLTGMAEMDPIGLPVADRAAFADILGRHPQVCGVIAGHVHRAITGGVAGRPALTIPSTYCQLPLDLSSTSLRMVDDEPLAFAVHTVIEDRLVAHVVSLPFTAGRLPG